MSINHENLKMTEKELDNLKKSYFEVSDNEQMRSAVRLSKDNLQGLDRQFYSVEASKEENLKIDSFLSHSHELKLSERQQRELQLRKNRNLNFELMNDEKWSGDSDHMQKVKDYIKKYEEALSATVDISSKENTVMALNYVKELASDAAGKCNLYLARGKSIFFWRRGRYNAVEKAYDRLTTEHSELNQLYERLKKEIDNDGKVPENEKMDGLILEGDTFITLLASIKTREAVRRIERHSKPEERSEDKKKLADTGENNEQVQKKKKGVIRIKEADLELPENEKLKKQYEKNKKRKDAKLAQGIKQIYNNYMVVLDSKNELINRQERREQVKEGKRASGAYRDDMRAASNMAFLHGYSEKQMMDFYGNIRTPYSKGMDKAVKVPMAKSMEAIFDTIKDFDLTKMNFKTLKELASRKHLKNRAMAGLAMGTEYHINQYLKMMRDNDSGLELKYDENGIKELKAKVNTLMTLDSYFGNVQEIITELGTDGLKYLDLSMEDLQKKMTETNKPVYATIMNLKASIYENDGTGNKLFGPGMDIKNLYNEHRRKLGLDPVK